MRASQGGFLTLSTVLASTLTPGGAEIPPPPPAPVAEAQRTSSLLINHSALKYFVQTFVKLFHNLWPFHHGFVTTISGASCFFISIAPALPISAIKSNHFVRYFALLLKAIEDGYGGAQTRCPYHPRRRTWRRQRHSS